MWFCPIIPVVGQASETENGEVVMGLLGLSERL